jgi:hypothetical protein
MTLKKILLITIILIPSLSNLFETITRYDFTDADTFWHLACGKQILELGYIPKTDTFSFNTNLTEWININWLAQILLFKSYYYFDYFGPAYISYFCVAIYTILFFKYCAKETLDPLISSLFFALTINTILILNLVRPQIFSLLLFTLITYFYLLKPSSKKLSHLSFILLTIIFIFWSQLHGGIIVGYFVLSINVIGSYLNNLVYNNSKQLSKRQIQYCLAMLVSIIVFYFHPLGYKALFYILNYSGNLEKLYYETVIELKPFILDFSNGKYVLIPVIVSLYVSLKKKLDINYEIALTSVSLLLISLHTLRFLPFFFIYSSPFIIKMCTEYLYDKNSENKYFFSKANYINLIASSFCLLTLPIFLNFYSNSKNSIKQFDKEMFPINAINYFSSLEEENVNVLTHYNFAGYFIWMTNNKAKVFIDGRGDLHSGIPTYQNYLEILKMVHGWRNILNSYKIDYIFMYRNEPFVDQLKRENWQVVYSDELFEIIKKPKLNS